MNNKLTKYKYYPQDPKKLKLKEVLHKLRDYRLLFIFSIPLYLIWGSFVLAGISMTFAYDFKASQDYKDILTFYAVLIGLQGIDLTDEGWLLTGFQQIFSHYLRY